MLHLAICIPRLLTSRVPEYFTGLITMSLAVERYILVIMPLKAEQLLSGRNRRIAYTAVTATIFIMLGGEALFRFLQPHGRFVDKRHENVPTACLLFPYESQNYVLSAAVPTLLLYGIPAVVSFLLYLRVGHALLTKKTNARRNQVLTVALLTSCMMWILLWGVAYLMRLCHLYLRQLMFDLMACLTGWQVLHYPDDSTSDDNVYDYDYDYDYYSYNTNLAWVDVYNASPFLGTTSALMNAVCLLVAVKHFWIPFISLRKAGTNYICSLRLQ